MNIQNRKKPCESHKCIICQDCPPLQKSQVYYLPILVDCQDCKSQKTKKNLKTVSDNVAHDDRPLCGGVLASFHYLNLIITWLSQSYHYWIISILSLLGYLNLNITGLSQSYHKRCLLKAWGHSARIT